MIPGALTSPVKSFRQGARRPPGDARSDQNLGASATPTRTWLFGFYFNNVRIGFQTFASGLGSDGHHPLFAVQQGVLGAITGPYSLRSGDSVFSFTSGHSAFELGAICPSGAAGPSSVRPRARTVDARRRASGGAGRIS